MTINILTFTTLYPNEAQPSHGVFVENRLRHLLVSGEVKCQVVAPVPWFPFAAKRFGSYAIFAKVPKYENRHSIPITHPRYPVIPKIGMTIAPLLLALASYQALKNSISNGYDFEIIDAHYFFPDGVAAILLGRWLKKPVVITARGTDVNLIPQYSLPRKMILWAAHEAAASITVCKALKDELAVLGADPTKITPLRNGVDLDMFSPPIDRDKLRERLNITRRTILSVGHLIQRKGHNLVIKALDILPDTCLLIAGIGPEEVALRALAAKLGFSDRVRFLGLVSHEELKQYYGAADITVLASDREGWANVLLESMACGTPVVATKIWGTPEVVADSVAGLLFEERTPQTIGQTIAALFVNLPDREATRKYAESFSWSATSQGQLKIFRQICDSEQP